MQAGLISGFTLAPGALDQVPRVIMPWIDLTHLQVTFCRFKGLDHADMGEATCRAAAQDEGDFRRRAVHLGRRQLRLPGTGGQEQDCEENEK